MKTEAQYVLCVTTSETLSLLPRNAWEHYVAAQLIKKAATVETEREMMK